MKYDWDYCNATLEEAVITEEPIWNGYTIHQLGLRISAVCGLFAIAVSFVLIMLHATHYLRPTEQRHILRILFMVPIYAAVSFLSFKYYAHTVYFEVLGDCYEAFAIASFFSLLCSYLADDLHLQKQYFREITPKNWILPLNWLQKCTGGEHAGPFRKPRSGLTWFNVIWVCIFQYCFIRVTMTIVSVVTQVFGRYCLESISPAFAHVWVMVIEGVAVSVAMYALIQFYVQIRQDISQHSPILKVVAIKLVIFLSFWQSIIISFLTSSGALKPSNKIQTPDIKVGIPSMLLCIEMAIFAIYHIFAFSYRPYVIGSKANQSQVQADPKPTPDRYQGGFLGILALLDAFNPWDFVKSTARSFRWLFKGRKTRHEDISYHTTRMNSNLKIHDSDSSGDGFDISTSYKPDEVGAAARDDDQQMLLSAQQPMPMHSSSPYKTDAPEYFDAGDIGVAHSTDGVMESRHAMPMPQARPAQPYQPQNRQQQYGIAPHPSQYHAYHGNDAQSGTQQPQVAPEEQRQLPPYQAYNFRGPNVTVTAPDAHQYDVQSSESEVSSYQRSQNNPSHLPRG